jgi:acid stress-induced BolA-like protein IbaG/YrbA
MTERERYKEMLTRSMEGHLESPQIDVIESDPYRYQGIIVSPTFDGMEDWERQEQVWDRVYKTFDEEDRPWLDFIFTNTPAEIAAYAEANEPTAEKVGNPL